MLENDGRRMRTSNRLPKSLKANPGYVELADDPAFDRQNLRSADAYLNFQDELLGIVQHLRAEAIMTFFCRASARMNYAVIRVVPRVYEACGSGSFCS